MTDPDNIDVEGEIDLSWTSYYTAGEGDEDVIAEPGADGDNGDVAATEVHEALEKMSESEPTVIIKPNRSTYHLLDDDGEVVCNYAKASNGEDRGRLELPISEVSDGWDECQRCADKYDTEMTRADLVHAIRLRACGTARDSEGFNKEELRQILAVVSGVNDG